MKIQKIALIVFTSVTILSFTACNATTSSIAQAELDQAINTAYSYGRTIGYNEGYKAAQIEVVANNDPIQQTTIPEDINLPILITKDGTWLNQNGDKMSPVESKTFFTHHPEYTKVAVAINLLHEDILNDNVRLQLEGLKEDAESGPHNNLECLSYWPFYNEVLDTYSLCLDSYTRCLNDFCQQFSNQVDLDTSLPAKITASIIYSRTMLFQESGLYDEVANSGD